MNHVLGSDWAAELKRSALNRLDNSVNSPAVLHPRQWQTARLEAVGTKIRLFVDGQSVFETDDPHQPPGNPDTFRTKLFFGITPDSNEPALLEIDDVSVFRAIPQ